MKTVAILICGKAGVGKSTFANMLYGYLPAALSIPMAQEVKYIAQEHFGWEGIKDEKGRKLLQVLGTEVGRAYNENIWVDTVLNKYFDRIQMFPNLPGVVLISDDVRFKNEITRCIESMDLVLTIRIVGPCRIKMPKGTEGHASEVGLDYYEDFDFTVDNSGTYDDLRIHAKEIAAEIERYING